MTLNVHFVICKKKKMNFILSKNVLHLQIRFFANQPYCYSKKADIVRLCINVSCCIHDNGWDLDSGLGWTNA